MEIVDQPVEDILYRIGELTGRPSSPWEHRIQKFTVITHRPMPRSKALDLIFRALVLNDIGTIEREDVILIGDLDDIAKLRQQPVLTADDDVMMRQDLGSYVAKIFRLENVKVDAVEPILTASLPTTSASRSMDPATSSWCMQTLPIANTCSRLLRNWTTVRSPRNRTWRLRHADAEAVASNVTDLFESDGSHPEPPLEVAPKPDRPAEQRHHPRVDGGSLGAK